MVEFIIAIVELFVCVGVVGVVGVDGVEKSLLLFFGDGGGCGGVSSPSLSPPLSEVSMVGVVVVVELECFLLLTRLPLPVLLLFVVVVVMGERTSFDLLFLLFLSLLSLSGVMVMDGKSSCPTSSSISSSSPSKTLVGAAAISKSSLPVVSVDGIVEKEEKW